MVVVAVGFSASVLCSIGMQCLRLGVRVVDGMRLWLCLHSEMRLCIVLFIPLVCIVMFVFAVCSVSVCGFIDSCRQVVLCVVL